jgi:hypothetical protein
VSGARVPRGLSPGPSSRRCVDVKIVHRAPELSETVAGLGVLRVHTEDGRFVAVERDRLPMPSEVAARRLEVVERRLGASKPQFHDAAGRIIDVDQERASRTAVLEPVVQAPVDLDKLAETGAAISRLVHALGALATCWRSVSTDSLSPWSSVSFS